MLYLSDHGEDIFDDARARYLHASPIPTYYQLHIPYIIWFSDDYRTVFAGEIPDGDLSRGLSGQHEQCVPYGIGYCRCPDFGIRFHTGPDQPSFLPFVTVCFSVITTNLSRSGRLGLKKADFVMLDKWEN